MISGTVDCPLLANLRNGDGCALHEFVDENFARITNYVARILRSHFEDAEEAANTAFHLATEQIRDGYEVTDPLALVSDIAYKRATDTIRMREAKKRKPSSICSLKDEIDTIEEDHAPTLRIETSVQDAMEVLSREEENVIRSIYFAGLSLRETAQATGYSLDNVRDLHESAKAKLRSVLADEFE